jgi:hypothetical protein
MKQHSKTLLTLALAGLLSTGMYAQEGQPSVPKWYSPKGYWVVEGNINTPLTNTIRFFNNENVLLYKETLTGVPLNPEKRRIKMKLKKVLENAVLAWEKKKVAEEDKQYVAALLR